MFIFLSFSILVLILGSSIVVGGHGHGNSPSLSGAESNVRFDEAIPQRPAGGNVDALRKRQACGNGVGSCPTGQCCSSGGQCGNGAAFCAGPMCLLAYGPACDGNISPPGASTASIARPILGSVPYGVGISHCKASGVVALTFDDGPCKFTAMVLATLAKYNVSATFFINGNSLGKGRIDDPTTPWPQILKNMYTAGHQLASHTWTHQDLTSLPTNLMQNQVIYNEMAFRNIFGFFPTYIRPPYGYCGTGSACSTYLNSMGYHIILWDIDTKDYINDDPTLILNSEKYFSGNTSDPANGHSYIPLAHDIHLNTALTLVTYMLDTLKARGYKAVTVGECMGDARANWYRDAGGVSGSSSSTVQTTAPRTGTTTSTRSTTSKVEATAATTNKALSMAATSTSISTHVSAASTTVNVAPKSDGNRLFASPWLPWVLSLWVSITILGGLV